MSGNIFRCKTESDLNEILNDNAHTLVTIMYVTTQSDQQNKLKKCLINLANDNNNCMFIYIDVESYFGTEHTITKTITTLPSTFIYLNNESLAVIEGNCTLTIKKTFGDVIQLVSKKITLSRDENSTSTSAKLNNNVEPKQNDVKIDNINAKPDDFDAQQIMLEEQKNNENNMKIKKVQKNLQLLTIKQLERLKKLKELEENNENY